MSAISTEPERAGVPGGQGVALEAQALQKAFGGVHALAAMALDVEPGSITGLIGPNGAGKSTFFDVVTGVLPADGGQVRLFGEDVTGLKPHQLAQRGMVRTFQLARELGRLTVLENLMLAPQAQLGDRLVPIFTRPGRVRAEEREIYARALEVLDFAKLSQLRDDYAQDISGGQKKLLELARALMIDCRIILLDEPGAGVNPALMNTLVEIIARLNAEHDKTFLIIEHDMDLVARLCDPVVVMTVAGA